MKASTDFLANSSCGSDLKVDLIKKRIHPITKSWRIAILNIGVSKIVKDGHGSEKRNILLYWNMRRSRHAVVYYFYSNSYSHNIF